MATVEGELEKALHNKKFISDCNFGKLQKSSWSRASRTDKKVSAAMNVISCKLHKYDELSEDKVKELINEVLPKDIRIFKIIEVSNAFDSKEFSHNREYHYILPSFCLQPQRLIKDLLELDSDENTIREKKKEAYYKYKIQTDYHEKIQTLFKMFRGTHRYHNYTKKVQFSDPQAQRHMYDLNCDEIIEFESFQCIKFKFIGQSFLYNQIRKMIGMMIYILREEKSLEFFENSFLSNKVDIPIAPAEGLYLYKVDYSKYNVRKAQKKNNIELNDKEEYEIDQFAKRLVDKVCETELKSSIFFDWIELFDKKKYET